MTMTDPIADMLTRVRNANQAYHETAAMPHSKIKVQIAEILANEGYIAGYTVEEPAEGHVGKTLSITLKYGQNRERSIAGVRRISKPGLRVYAGRARHCHHLHVSGSADRQAGAQQPRGRRSPRLRLVTGGTRRLKKCHALASCR
jgi:ribosomal protein S8